MPRRRLARCGRASERTCACCAWWCALGDYKQDSFYGQGMGTRSILPLDNDPIALRRQIWLLTDEAYKAAADAYAEKLSALKQFTADPNPVDDFAQAPVVTAVGETVKLKVDPAEWEKTLQDVTNLYREYPEVQSVNASARFTAVNEYFVNSEGTIVRRGRTTATVTLIGVDASGGWHAAGAESVLDGSAAGRTALSRRAAERNRRRCWTR